MAWTGGGISVHDHAISPILSMTGPSGDTLTRPPPWLRQMAQDYSIHATRPTVRHPKSHRTVHSPRDKKQHSVLFPVAAYDRTIRPHQGKRFYCRADGQAVIDSAVAIDANGTADAERIVLLHHSHGVTAPFKERNDSFPTRYGLNEQNLPTRIKLHPVKRPHIDDDSTGVNGVPSHTVP